MRAVLLGASGRVLADTVLELYVAAPDGVKGTVIVDLGLVEF